MTSKGRFLVSAAAVTISTMALAAAGAGTNAGGGAGTGATGGAGGGAAGPSAVINDPNGGTIRDEVPVLPPREPRATSWQGADSTINNPNDAPRMKPPIEIQGKPDNDQPQPYPTNVPATRPAVSRELPPAGTVTGNKLDATAGTGGVTSSRPDMQTAPGAAMPGTPPVVGAPSGFLQNEAAQANQQNNQQIRGGFGSSESAVNAPAGQAMNPAPDASQIDVTQRTQQLAQPAGSTLPPSRQPATRPVQQQPQQQGTRPEVPMPPAPSGNTGMGGFGTGQGTTR